jgi:hypothetical protein
MTRTTNLFLFLAIATILLTSPLAADYAYADKDNDKTDKKDNKQTKLQKECSKEPKNPSKIKPDCELLNLINENQPNPQADSFFDVFFDIYTTPDSFFDIFVDTSTGTHAVDSFFDIFTELSVHEIDIQEIQTELLALELRGTDPNTGLRPDSFFDIFTEISVHDADVLRIDTELVALDLRGQSCNVGDVVTGIDADGQILCAPDQQGGLGNVQDEIDAKNIQIADIENQIAVKDFDLGTLQIQLDALALPNIEILRCQQECASIKALQQNRLNQCAFDASQLGLTVEEHCSAELTALATPCICSTTSNPVLADQLVQQIASINAELAVLNDQLEKCQFELMVLETIQNQFGLPSDPTPGI